MIIAPDQEIFDVVYSVLLKDGLKPYDRRPEDFAKAELPLVYIGETQALDKSTKDSLKADVAITLAVWGGKNDRFGVSQLTARLFSLLANLRATEHLSIKMRLDQTARTVSEDTQGEVGLWLGQLDVTYRIL